MRGSSAVSIHCIYDELLVFLPGETSADYGRRSCRACGGTLYGSPPSFTWYRTSGTSFSCFLGRGRGELQGCNGLRGLAPVF